MKPVWTFDQVVAQLVNWGGRWDNSVPVPFMLYGQSLAHHEFKIGFAPFTAAEQQSLLRTMQLLSDAANISFLNIPATAQWPSTDNPFMGFYTINDASAPFWGAATRYVTDGAGPPEPMGRIYGVDIVVNHHRANVQGGWEIGDSNSRKLMHELLHGVGLDHAGDYNGDSAISYETHASFFQDSHQYTVMSYWAASETGASHLADGVVQFASTPLLYDVAALQALYGANMSTRTGNTVYGFNNTSGRAAFDLQRDPSAIFTIWDAGGVDTLDLSGFSSPSRVDLREGAFSDAGGMTLNLSIAFGTNIENAIGGLGDDSLRGNLLANVLDGGAGNDLLFGAGGNNVLEGGTGSDTAEFASARGANAVYALGKTVAVLNVVTRQTDRTHQVETLRFQDDTLDTSTLAQFSALDYIAGYDDLARAFGADAEAGFLHFAYAGFFEGRVQDGFDGFEYLAGHDDLIVGLGPNETAAAGHFLAQGLAEGRLRDGFDGFEYVAAYGDLISAFGADESAAARHFVTYGFSEGRQRDAFDGIQYTAGYADLIGAFGADESAAARHFVTSGFSEGRQLNAFDAIQYIAGYDDLIGAFGADKQAGALHFVAAGFHEGRSRDAFDADQYLDNYADLRAAFGDDHHAAALHYIGYGYVEGRTDMLI